MMYTLAAAAAAAAVDGRSAAAAADQRNEARLLNNPRIVDVDVRARSSRTSKRSAVAYPWGGGAVGVNQGCVRGQHRRGQRQGRQNLSLRCAQVRGQSSRTRSHLHVRRAIYDTKQQELSNRHQARKLCRPDLLQTKASSQRLASSRPRPRFFLPKFVLEVSFSSRPNLDYPIPWETVTVT